ncbi:hypothetical protein AVEN_166587-1 [Araneus ventricosus]|uniref:Uncharacterized protein n=1 Tax=Araneus ventricosus TaxID=182803 RepID=A0A4Y2KJA1_ARAVE|nr:hypothetical protein AVEN_166587-1 [Araneus ventricosus]
MNPASLASTFEKPMKQFESMKDFGNKDNMPGMEQAEDAMEHAKEAMEQGRKLAEDAMNKMKDLGDFAVQHGKFIHKEMPAMN